MRPRNDTDWLAVAVEMCRRTVIVDGKVYAQRRHCQPENPPLRGRAEPAKGPQSARLDPACQEL
jgi:hypothetical protein